MSAINGISPKQTVTSFKHHEEAQSREVLRRGWNQLQASGKINGKERVLTPFRAVNNAGDLLNRVAYTSGGSNQVNTGRIKTSANYSGNILGGSIFAKPDGSGVPSATTNVKWVYDGSDYTRFKKQQAANRSYNDWSFGGSNNGSYTAYSRIRH